jgi:hypothetical protein
MSRFCSSLAAVVVVVGGSAGPAASQPPEEAANAKVWLGRAAEYEDFLRSAAVVRTEDLPVGVTRPIRCHFAPGGLAESIAFKSIQPGLQTGFWESYKSEIAAYELDKLLELQMVPPTVEKRVNKIPGAAVMWVSPVRSFKQMGGVPTAPPAHAESWSRQLSRAKMFDNLIANKDPNLGNWLVDPAWNLILIDHTRAFVSSKDLVHKMNRIDRGLWGRMMGLDAASLKTALGRYLADGQIEDIVARRDRMKAVIEKMVAERGEASVFYP